MRVWFACLFWVALVTAATACRPAGSHQASKPPESSKPAERQLGPDVPELDLALYRQREYELALPLAIEVFQREVNDAQAVLRETMDGATKPLRGVLLAVGLDMEGYWDRLTLDRDEVEDAALHALGRGLEPAYLAVSTYQEEYSAALRRLEERLCATTRGTMELRLPEIPAEQFADDIDPLVEELTCLTCVLWKLGEDIFSLVPFVGDAVDLARFLDEDGLWKTQVGKASRKAGSAVADTIEARVVFPLLAQSPSSGTISSSLRRRECHAQVVVALLSPFSAGAKQLAKSKLKKEVVERTAKAIARAGRKGALGRVERKFGKEGVEAVARVAAKSGRSERHVASVLSRLSPRCTGGKGRVNRTALAFAVRHSSGGEYFCNLVGFDGLRKWGLTKRASEADDVVEEGWRLVDPSAVGGSWAELRRRLRDAGMNGTQRDFAEELFVMRAKAGRIDGLPKGVELQSGHIGNARIGIDFILPTKDGKVRLIEFGTGVKPSSEREMTWEKLRDQLQKWASKLDTDRKIALRAQGIDQRLFDPKFYDRPAEELSEYFQREYYAVEWNAARLRALGPDVIPHPLP